MKNIDFLFIYEVKLREFETVVLLMTELERRGYRVALLNTWSYIADKPPRYNPKVVVTSALYDDETFRFFSCYTSNMDKVVNLQWEQIATMKDMERIVMEFEICGQAKHAVHLCWGKHTVDRIVNICGVNERKAVLTGYIPLDFVNEKVYGYYRDRSSIYDEFNLDTDKKTLLFISSFAYVNAPENYSDVAGSFIDKQDVEKSIRTSIESQQAILGWFMNFLESNKETVIIYRPHPAELENMNLLEIEKKYPGFRVIKDYTVGQWIYVCDKVYTWLSTSIAEVYAQKKICYILRPTEVSEALCPEYYALAHVIRQYGEFEDSVKNNINSFPIDAEVFESYYCTMLEFSYIKTCNVLEMVYNDNSYILPKATGTAKNSLVDRIGIAVYRSRALRGLIRFLSSDSIKKHIKNKRVRNMLNVDFSLLEDMTKRNNYTDEELARVKNKIKRCFY